MPNRFLSRLEVKIPEPPQTFILNDHGTSSRSPKKRRQANSALSGVKEISLVQLRCFDAFLGSNFQPLPFRATTAIIMIKTIPAAAMPIFIVQLIPGGGGGGVAATGAAATGRGGGASFAFTNWRR